MRPGTETPASQPDSCSATTVQLHPPSAVLWDMDGTLIDQTGPIIRCYHTVIEALGYAPPAPDAIHRSMGGPMRQTMALFVEDRHLDEACGLFRKHFPQLMFDGLIVLPGAHECIRYFAELEIPQAILTNKHGETARAVSAHCGFDLQIAVCLGNTDTPWEKPDPELTAHVLAQLGAQAKGSVLIGDSPTDVATAQRTGMLCYGVATGAHRTEELLAAGAVAAFANLTDLLHALPSSAS